MRSVIQRVTRASVCVEGRVIGRIGVGYVALVGFAHGDDQATLEWMANKLVGLRLFPDDSGRMNRSLGDVQGSILVVSQFTLYADVQRGRRPSFLNAADPSVAVPLYERFVQLLRDLAVPVETGEFGAMMDVELVNSGPVTLMVER